MRLAGLTIAAGLLLAGAAHAEELWVVSSNDRALVLIDVASIQNTPLGYKRVWMTRLLKAPETTVEGKPFDYYRMSVEFDCAGERMHTVHVARYTAAGASVNARDVSTEWDPIAPGGNSAAIRKWVCNGDVADKSSKLEQPVETALKSFRNPLSETW